MSSESCLLNTTVTWEDVEMELQKSLNTTARFGENKKVSHTGDLKGFMSKVALIEPDWEGDSDGLPKRFCVKISSTSSLGEFFSAVSYLRPDVVVEKSEEQKQAEQEHLQGILRYYHNMEVDAYKFITKEDNPNLLTTRIYGSKAYSEDNKTKGFLVSEFIPDVFGLTNHDIVPYEDFGPVIDSLAAFSAIGEKMSDEEKKASTVGFGALEGRVAMMIPEDASKVQELLVEALGAWDPIDKVMEIIKLVCSKTSGILGNYSKIFEFLGHAPVLLHTDVWLGNMLFTKDSNDKLVFKALIDFQNPSLSSPGLDVAWAAVYCLSAKDRAAHKTDMLQRYYNSFKANLRGAPVPYTFQQLQDSYELCFVPIAISCLPIFWCMTKYAEPEEALVAAREKMRGLVEDLIVMQEENEKKFPKFFVKFD